MILIVGHFGTLYSYATVGGRVAEALREAGMLGRVANLDDSWHPRWEKLRWLNEQCTHVLVFTAPNHYISTYPNSYGRERSAIFVSPNTDTVDGDHAETISKFGMAIAPSQWCRNTVSNGLQKMKLEAPTFMAALPLGAPVAYNYSADAYRRCEDKAVNVLHFTSDQVWPSRKGTETLLAAWKLLSTKTRDDARLTIHGPPALRKDALYAIADLGVDESVTYLPSPKLGTPDEEIEGLYRRADLVVSPSRSEGFGMMILGALVTGVPLLTTCVTGHAEFLAERPGSWLTIPTPSTGAMAYEGGDAPVLCERDVMADVLDLALMPSVRQRMIRRKRPEGQWGTWAAALPLWVERIKDWMEE